MLIVMLGLICVIAPSCGTASTNNPPDSQPSIPTVATKSDPLKNSQASTTTKAPTTDQQAITTTIVTTHQQESAPTDQEKETEVLYLEEIIPPCAAVDGSSRDPCAAGTLPVIVHHDELSEAAKIHAPPLETILNYWDSVRSKSTHIVLRGTVLPDTTRCEIYDLIMADYLDEAIRQQFSGWRKVNCFSDVRVNEYLLGTGPPQLSVIMWIENPPGPPSLKEQVADAYEGAEGILFLSTGHSLQLEAWEMAYFWDVQQIDSETRVIATDKDEYPQTPENLALLDNTLADFRTKITKAAATRAAHTGGRIGTDPSLPLLLTDANQLSTYYGAIGAVYDNPEQAPTTPPPVPGAEQPPTPPANTGENQQPQTPPAPGEDTQPPDSTP